MFDFSFASFIFQAVDLIVSFSPRLKKLANVINLFLVYFLVASGQAVPYPSFLLFEENELIKLLAVQNVFER